MPLRASNFCVSGVALESRSEPPIGSRCSRSQICGDMARQTIPQALRIMKLIASGVAFSAAMTRSPSFSRYSSSTRTIIRPWRSSSSASSIVQNPSAFVDMLRSSRRRSCQLRHPRGRSWQLRLRAVYSYCTMTPMHADAERTAYHEAGHAVMALVLGRPVDHVSIRADAVRLGHCEFRKPVFRPSEDWLEREMLISLAGPAAESIFAGEYEEVGASF